MKVKIVEYKDSGWVDIYLNGEKWYEGTGFHLVDLVPLLRRLDCEVSLELVEE